MHLTFRNVNDAFRGMVGIFAKNKDSVLRINGAWQDVAIEKSTSRNGDVLYIQEPVILTYTHPRERVLFNQARDANPFFHLYEALWMLAGRNDVAPLAYYNSNIAYYSDDSKTFNGAYGYRWRHEQVPEQGRVSYGDQTYMTEVDQLRILVDHLKAVPDSRRAVLQMWNVEGDLLKIGQPKCPKCGSTSPELHPAVQYEGEVQICPHQFHSKGWLNGSKDVCCNTHVYFSLRAYAKEDSQGQVIDPEYGGIGYYLDMTVCNRSNDLIWGLLGANAVHFSFLQEYMAACIGAEVGVYSQITNNCHVYLNDKWQPEKWLADNTPSEYDYKPDYLCPLVKDPATFDRECAEFVSINPLKDKDPQPECSYWKEPFLANVAQPMCNAFMFHKMRIYEVALQWAEKVQSDDWRIAGTNWLLKRKAAYEARAK